VRAVVSIKAVKWALSAKGISHIKKLTLATIAECHNAKTGKCIPSQQYIADALGQTDRSARKHVTDLEADGFFKREPRYDRFGHRTSDSYVLNFEISEPTGKHASGSLPENMLPVVETSLPENSESLPEKIEVPTGKLASGTNEPESRTGILEPEEEGASPSAPSTPIELHKVWTEGKPILIDLGVPKSQAGSMIGRWLKETGEDKDRVHEAIKFAREKGTGEPIPLIINTLKAGGARQPAKSSIRRVAEQMIRDIAAEVGQ
jgi:hypothetical protein